MSGIASFPSSISGQISNTLSVWVFKIDAKFSNKTPTSASSSNPAKISGKATAVLAEELTDLCQSLRQQEKCTRGFMN